MVLEYSIIVFITQLVFIGARTWNVRAISEKNIVQLMLSGAVVHITWLISITIGVVSMNEILQNMKLEYIPIIIASLTGGLIGSYIGLNPKKKGGKSVSK